MKKSVRIVLRQAIICALYVAFTLIVTPIAYGQIQFRISEILILLCFYDKKNAIGLVLGCFIANCFSPMFLFDITLGVAATALSLVCIMFIKNMYIGAICPVVINAGLVGLELYIALEKTLPYGIYALWVALGEAVVMIVGVIIFKILEKNKYIYDRILVGNYECSRD